MICKYFSIILFLFLFIDAIPQSIETIDSLKKVHKSSNVVVLKDYDKLTIDIKNNDLLMSREVFSRKLYTNNKAQAYSEDYISESSFMEHGKIIAYTEILENGKFKKYKTKEIKEEKFIDNDVFYQDIRTYKFLYPALKENAISNCRSFFNIKDPHFISGNFFQSVFPIEDLEFIVDVDENVDIDFVKINFDSIKYEQNIEKKNNRIIYTFKAKQIPKLDEGEKPPPIKYVIPHIIPHIKSYKINSTDSINVLRNLDDLYAWYKTLLNSQDECGNLNDIENVVNNTIVNCKTEIEKVEAIYRWVQKNINYIAIEVGLGGFIPECANNVFKKKYGDCKGMSNLLYNMLKMAGIQSYITWIGTTDLPYVYSELPTPAVDNHMIVTYIDENNRYYFLDATGKYDVLGMPGSFIQGKEAMIDKENTYEIKKVPIMPCENNLLMDSIYLKISDDIIDANGHVTFSGYYYTIVRNRIANILEAKEKNKFINNYFTRGNNKYLVSKTKETIDKEKGEIKFDYDFTIGNYITKSDDKIFVNMNIFKDVLTDKIDDDKESLLMFLMKNSYQYYVELELPENYKVNHIPENANFENEYYKYDIKYSLKDDKHLIYELYVHYNTLQLRKEEFYLFNDFSKSIYKNFREVVILEKTK